VEVVSCSASPAVYRPTETEVVCLSASATVKWPVSSEVVCCLYCCKVSYIVKYCDFLPQLLYTGLRRVK
jgi:hypothetical protein